jgi:GAF domain-containing protein
VYNNIANLTNTSPSELLEGFKSMLIADDDGLSQLANASSTIYQLMTDLNWAGFYLYKHGQLVLGPFQGKPACIRIPLDKGVCGKAAREKHSVRVDDVHLFPGHIACDAASRSELVVPLVKKGALLGVIDLDSPNLARFSSSDQAFVEQLAEQVVELVHWNHLYLG